MSFSFSDFSSGLEVGGSISAATPVTPTENVWLEFDFALDRKRDELKAALHRFRAEDGDLDVAP
ncbi:MAG TPA: hypothetical protein VF645_05910 [Allosphingosinicella sp.]|jgi:hypothetical protein